MSYEQQYERILKSFETNRRDILYLLKESHPPPELEHGSFWRMKQMENSIDDIKETIAASALHIERSQAKLSELYKKNQSLQAQERRLSQDLKILQGITGIASVLPDPNSNKLSKEVESLSKRFHSRSIDLSGSLPHVNHSLLYNNAIETDLHHLIQLLKDFVNINFDMRATDAELSKAIDGYAREYNRIEQEYEKKIIIAEKKLNDQKKLYTLNTSDYEKKLRSMISEVRRGNQNQYKSNKLLRAEIEQEAKILEEKLSHQTQRVDSLKSFVISIKNSKKSHSRMILEELDRLEKRISYIKHHNSPIDSNLINMDLLTGNKSHILDEAITKTRDEIKKYL